MENEVNKNTFIELDWNNLDKIEIAKKIKKIWRKKKNILINQEKNF